MQFLAIIAIIYFMIGSCVCLLICVNPNDSGILATLNRFVFRKIPAAFSQCVRSIFGERILNCLGGVKHYLMETNHPIVQIFYLLIAVGGFIGYSFQGIFKHMPNAYVGNIHVIIANFLAILCFWVYFKACKVSPGKLTKQSEKQFVEKYQDYYDGVLYRKNNKCNSCNLVKPARSKHCSVCQMCVAKFDHHCIWIRQCVGERNYKYFVSFLLLHGIWCLYLSIIGSLSLVAFLDTIQIWGQKIRVGNEIRQVDIFIIMQFLLMDQTMFFFLIIMCAIMGVTLIIFVSYHFYLIALGQTTNQRVKKNDQIDYMKKEIKYIDGIAAKNGGQLPKEIQFRSQLFKKKELEDYQSKCRERLAILVKQKPNRGFIHNLKVVFNQKQ